MILNFNATVHALIGDMVGDFGLPATSFSLEKVQRFVLEQHGRMPDYLRFPFRCLVLAFDAWPFPSAACPFHRLPAERRMKQIQAWRQSSLPFMRDLMRFYATLVVFGIYSEAVRGQDPLPALQVSAHQEHAPLEAYDPK